MPNTKEDIFWNDETVLEFAKWYRFSSSRTSIEQYKKSRQPILEYEIISFISVYAGLNDVIFKVNKSGIFHPQIGFRESFTLSYLLSQPTAKIHSVKRISDSEVFTLDEILSSGATIKGFELARDFLQIHLSDNISGWYSNIQSLIKKKQPLFTTNDGKDIYEGDKFVSVQKRTFDILTDCTYQLTNPDMWVTFSTEEAANEYVNLHKPVLPAQDIIDYFESWVVKPSEYTKNIIIKLAKQKINGV